MDVKTCGSIKIAIHYNTSRNGNIRKTITCFFLILQLMSGLNFGFIKLFHENVQQFLRIFTIFVACVYNVIVFSPLFLQPNTLCYGTSFVIMPSIEYILNAIILLWYNKYNTYDFLKNISEYCFFKNNDVYMFYLMSVIHFIISFTVKSIFILMIVLYDVKIEPYVDQLPTVYSLFLLSYYTFVDLIAIAQIVIYYHVYCSMKHLKHMLVSSDQKLNVICEQYKAIVDTCDKIWPLSDSLVSNTVF